MALAINLFEQHPDLTDVSWVFAYGSLIWNPEIEFVSKSIARVHGYHRAFCVSSTRYRGTPETPGIVLGLDRGGCVEGVGYHLPEHSRQAGLHHIMMRELPPDSDFPVYEKRIVTMRLADGSQARALTFVANRHVPSYVKLSDSDIVQRLAACRGHRGANHDYAVNTWASLKELGLHDGRLAQLVSSLQKVVRCEKPLK